MTLEIAVSQENQISKLRVTEPDTLELLISLMIESVASSLNSKNTMDAYQIDECCLLLIEKYWMLRPEEILLVFKNAKLGQYGTDFNRIDILTISGWIDKYINFERTPYFEKLNSTYTPEVVPDEKFMQKYNDLIHLNRVNPNHFRDEAHIRRAEENEKIRQKFKEKYSDEEFEQFKEKYFKTGKL